MMRGQEAGGKKKDGARKKTKPYTTIPSRGFAPGKLPLDRPHQGAAMLTVTASNGYRFYRFNGSICGTAVCSCAVLICGTATDLLVGY